jgi:hypothetical protein
MHKWDSVLDMANSDLLLKYAMDAEQARIADVMENLRRAKINSNFG